MCTVTYVKHADSVVITTNRDEAPSRNAATVSLHLTKNGSSYHVPKEPVHGGSNLAVGVERSTWTLLNGAFAPHEMGKSYRMSRGLVLLEALEYHHLQDFSEAFDFEGIEPFTLLHFAEAIEEMRWDGANVHFKKPDPDKPQIWASAQLYLPAAINARRRWFTEVLEGKAGADELWDLHRHGGDGDPANDMVMQRYGMVQTVSISQIIRAEEGVLRHLDLLNDQLQQLALQAG